MAPTRQEVLCEDPRRDMGDAPEMVRVRHSGHGIQAGRADGNGG